MFCLFRLLTLHQVPLIQVKKQVGQKSREAHVSTLLHLVRHSFHGRSGLSSFPTASILTPPSILAPSSPLSSPQCSTVHSYWYARDHTLFTTACQMFCLSCRTMQWIKGQILSTTTVWLLHK